MLTSEGGLGHQEVLWLLGSLYRIPFDPKLVEQDFAPPHSLTTFHETARALGFKTGHSQHPADSHKLPLLAISFLRATPETTPADIRKACHEAAREVRSCKFLMEER